MRNLRVAYVLASLAMLAFAAGAGWRPEVFDWVAQFLF